MVASGWAQFHRDLRTEMAYEGLVVDVRENGGGHVSELILEKLSRKVTGWIRVRGHQPMRYPEDSPRGPVVTVTDEFAYPTATSSAPASRTAASAPSSASAPGAA
ncbi:S41 family peptidase [Nonomuraea ferruginea]